MNEVTERVAKAMADDALIHHGLLLDPIDVDWNSAARAAISAMYEPTVEMMDRADFSLSERLGFPMVPEARRIWQLMIDEALRDNELPS